MDVTKALLRVRKPLRRLSAPAVHQSLSGKEVIRMKTSFNVAEEGEGPYRVLAILRWVMVLIFVSFGMQKFTVQSAQGIVRFISNSPFKTLFTSCAGCCEPCHPQ